MSFSADWDRARRILAPAIEHGGTHNERDVFDAVVSGAAQLWMLGDSAGAQDVVQDALIKLLQTDQYKGEAGLATYFHTIVTRLCLDRLRVLKGSPFLSNDDLALLEVPDNEDADPPHRLAHAQQAQSVQQALMALAPRQRVALALWAYQDAEAAEIARIMGLQVNAVHQLLHRAKLNLRHQLGETHVPRT